MEKKANKFTKAGAEVDGVHGRGGGGGDPNDASFHPVGSSAGFQARAGNHRGDPNITVYGRGALNWEVLVDGHCVARFDAKADAFEWAELLRGKEGDDHE